MKAFAFHENGVVTYKCRACHERLATGRPVSIEMPYEVGDDEHGSGTISHNVDIGERVELEPGFVNAPTRHDTGLRWYRYRVGATEHRGRVRLSCVLTCACGADNRISAVADASAYATLPEEGRYEKLEDELAQQGADLVADNEVDRRKGN